MQFICLVYVDPSLAEKMTEADWQDMGARSQAYDRQLQESGHYIHAEALEEPKTAVTLHVRKGQMSTTDGPFAETKEHLGGFILVEARDLNEAIAIGSRIPMAELGSIEVRPIMRF